MPKGTRSIAIVIKMFAPETGSKVYAYVDNVSFALVKATDRPSNEGSLTRSS